MAAQDLVLHVFAASPRRRPSTPAVVVRSRPASVELVGGHAALRGVRLVDDHGEALVGEVVDAVHDEGELLDGGDDDFLAAFQMFLEIGRTVGMGDDVLDLGELVDVVAQAGGPGCGGR